jgi:Fe2+ transport system protein FeoA
VEPLLTTAADLPTDEPAVIAYLSSKDVADLRKLMAMGALPGTGIVVRQRFPSYLVDLGASQFGIDEHMARQIHVRREAPGKHRRRRHGVSS